MSRAPVHRLSAQQRARIEKVARANPELTLTQLGRRFNKDPKTLRELLGPEEAARRRGVGGPQWW